MPNLNISLTDELKMFLETEAAEGGFSSISEYLGKILRQERRRKGKQELEAKLREALASGPATPMTREDWDELERRVWERHHQENPPT